MALSKSERDALPADQFAVPDMRLLPIPDEAHVKMAWGVVDSTKGLTDDERAAAKQRILRRAEELGLDTDGWSLQAAALTSDERDALEESEFAVPAKRQLPIQDKKHVRLAWDLLDRTDGLTADEKRIAKERILKRAKDLGMDVSGWDIEVHAAASEPTKALDNEKLKKDAEAALAAALAAMSVTFWKAYILWLDPNGANVPDDAAASAYGDERAKTLLGLLNDTTRKQIDGSLAAGREAGETNEQLAERVRGITAPMADGRAKNVAATESTRASGWGSLQASKQAGIAQNSWITMRDDKVRDTHAAMDGSVRNVGEYFTSPSGAMALHPGGFGVPDEDCGCRCVLQSVKSDLEAAKATADSDWQHFEAIRQAEEEKMVPVIQGIFKAQADAMVDALTPPTITLQAMSLDMPATPDHPNKMPFSGVLTFLDRPSDNAPCGSGGRKVILTRAAAQAALPTLLGMAVDYTPKLDGHDVKAKIGIIDDAEIIGNQINIKGFLYAADFPEECVQIKKDVSKLGFSWELKDIRVDDLNADPWVINSCVFTGAALLQKQKAAYTSTSLAAAAEGANEEELDMATIEELMTKLNEISTKVDTLEKKEAAEGKTDLHANAEIQAKVKPHADALRKVADDMEANGIGCHASRGHVHALRKMAANMEAEAAKGVVPSEHNGDTWYASADVSALVASAVKSAVADVKPTNTPDPEVAVLKDGIASLKTMIADMQAAATKTAAAPERKTLSPAITSLLAKAGVGLPENAEEKMNVATLDGALSKASLSMGQRIELKTALRNAGLLN